MKEQVPKLMESYAVYQFGYPGCNDSYICKTECNLWTKTEEDACSDKGIAFTTILITIVIKQHSKCIPF